MKRVYRRVALGVLFVVLLLALARVALPFVVKDYLNRKMDRMGNYHGHLADVDINLWRGAYSIDDLRITRIDRKVPVPLFQAATTDISLRWKPLLHGMLRGRVVFDRASLNFVDGGKGGNGQTGQGVDWRRRLEQLVPMRIDELVVRNSKVTFHNFVSDPEVDLAMTDLNGVATNLTNADRRAGRRVSDVHATAKVLGDAPLEAQARVDPLARGADFDFSVRVRQIELKRLNDVAQAYANLDFESGHGTFVMQLEARDGQLEGYAKPLLHDVQVFSWKQDVEQQHENPLKVAWEAIAQGVEAIFKNQEKDQFATRVPIRGNIDDKKLGTWAAIVGVLHNAFVQAYTPKLEDLKPVPDEEH